MEVIDFIDTADSEFNEPGEEHQAVVSGFLPTLNEPAAL